MPFCLSISYNCRSILGCQFLSFINPMSKNKIFFIWILEAYEWKNYWVLSMQTPTPHTGMGHYAACRLIEMFSVENHVEVYQTARWVMTRMKGILWDNWNKRPAGDLGWSSTEMKHNLAMGLRIGKPSNWKLPLHWWCLTNSWELLLFSFWLSCFVWVHAWHWLSAY